jgi:hypothetical protein
MAKAGPEAKADAPRGKRATSYDVARLAAVSQSAVSRRSRPTRTFPLHAQEGAGGGAAARLPAERARAA